MPLTWKHFHTNDWAQMVSHLGSNSAAPRNGWGWEGKFLVGGCQNLEPKLAGLWHFPPTLQWWLTRVPYTRCVPSNTPLCHQLARPPIQSFLTTAAKFRCQHSFHATYMETFPHQWLSPDGITSGFQLSQLIISAGTRWGGTLIIG